MSKTFLEQTLEQVTEWTFGKFLAERTFYSKSGLLCVVLKPFVYEFGNRELLAMAEEGYVPHKVHLFFGTDPNQVAKEVRRYVAFHMKHED